MAMDAPMTAKRPVSPVSSAGEEQGDRGDRRSTSFVPTVTMPLAATETVTTVAE